MVEWQRALRPLDKQQRGNVSRTTIIKPDQRYDEIMKIVRNNQYNRDPYLKELNIRVDDKEMIKLSGFFVCLFFFYDYICFHLARVLTPPDIKYRRRGQGEVIERVSFGKWRVRNWFYESPTINSWGIIYFGDTPNRETNDILNEFQNIFPNVNIFIFSIHFYYSSFSSYFAVVVLELMSNLH